MYVLVRLLKGFSKPLFYKISEHLVDKVFVGSVVNVPIRSKNIAALVLKKQAILSENCFFKIKEILDIYQFPKDHFFREFIEKVAKFYFLDPVFFYQRIRSFLEKNKDSGIEFKNDKVSTPSEKISLTDEQVEAVDHIKKLMAKSEYSPVLLHGVTGSGKTEVYKKIILEALDKGKSVIFILPEVSLSIQFECLFKAAFSEKIKIIGFHSASRSKEKKELWRNLLDGIPTLIIGVHLPVLLPIPNLGLVIIDEEHENGFQEKSHPKINSKEIAIWRAKHYRIPVVLGSATPSLFALSCVKYKNWKLFNLSKRFSGNFPKIETVFLKSNDKSKRKSFWITEKLEREIKKTIAKKEQVIIYLNRRGYSFFAQCKKCGFVFQCPHCSVSLKLHKKDSEDCFLRCHYCGYNLDFPNKCPDCAVDTKDFLKKGIGTQQVVNILKKIFSDAKIERADLDSVSKKRSWEKALQRFQNGGIDILVGTKLITKGYHFPKVTLVGVLWADLNFNLPTFNASELALQQLIQVSGRAGRQSNESKVIIQAMQDHNILKKLSEKEYISFCEEELEVRRLTNYPPFGRFVQLDIKSADSEQLDKDAKDIYDEMVQIKEHNNLNIDIFGPIHPVVYRIQKIESRNIFLKSISFKDIYLLINRINFKKRASRVFIVPMP